MLWSHQTKLHPGDAAITVALKKEDNYMNINALKAYVAFLSADLGGGIDYEKSCKNLIGDLNTYEAQLEVTGTKVKDAILAVFAKYKGTNLNKPALASFAMQGLDSNPSNYSAYQEGIDQFLLPIEKGGNVGTRESGALIGMRKGVGGGFWLWADKPEEPATTAK
jgi:hypothetical protein